MAASGSALASVKRARPSSAIQPYLLGILGVVLATLLRLPFEGALNGRAPYALYFLPILYVAWRYGFGPTAVTALVSLLAAWYRVLPEPYSFVDKQPGALPSLVLFVLVSAAMILLSRNAAKLRAHAVRNDEACRRAEQAAEAAVWDHDAVTGEFEAVALNRLFGIDGPQGRTAANRLEELIHHDDRARYRESWALARESNEPVRVEYRVNHPTRGERWFASIGQASAPREGRAWTSGITSTSPSASERRWQPLRRGSGSGSRCTASVTP